jgi:hypothetical protein
MDEAKRGYIGLVSPPGLETATSGLPLTFTL